MRRDELTRTFFSSFRLERPFLFRGLLVVKALRPTERRKDWVAGTSFFLLLGAGSTVAGSFSIAVVFAL
jgi:hypothetical protein